MDNKTSLTDDMYEMHKHFNIHEKVEQFSKEDWKRFLKFRLDFLQEELNEGYKALEEENAEEFIDFLVDLTVVTVGTAALLEFNFDYSWNNVLASNLSKEVGLNKNRPNEFGLPDLIKTDKFIKADHSGNHGLLHEIFSKELDIPSR